jgi:hypothetical protein
MKWRKNKNNDMALLKTENLTMIVCAIKEPGSTTVSFCWSMMEPVHLRGKLSCATLDKAINWCNKRFGDMI